MADLQLALQERRWRAFFPKTNDPDRLHAAFCRFAREVWYIKHPERGKILFELREAQEAVVRDWIVERNCIALKARQIGFSTLAAAFAFWETFGYPDRFEVMLSKGEREAVKLLAKAKYGYRNLPQWMKLRGPRVVGQGDGTQQKMEFTNDSSIESLPSKNDPARGESVYRVWIDEWAFLDNPEEAWASIEPITDVGGRAVGISTANGWGNFFHEMWVGSNTGVNSFKPFFRNWRAADRDDAWYERQKAKFSARPWILHQEYPNDPDEAFIKSGNTVFDVDKLREREAELSSPPHRHTLMYLERKRFKLYESPQGELRVWERPERGGVYVIGADIAEGLEHGDYSVAQVLKAGTGEQVAVWHGHIDADLFGEVVLASLGWWYNGALILPENNNHGLTTIKALQRAKYANLYRQRRLQDRHAPQTEMYGFRTTQATKPYVIDELNRSLREKGVAIHDSETYAELKTYVRDERGRMNGSPHDDRVMALALANEALKYAYLPEYQQEREDDYGTYKWLERMLDAAEAKTTVGGAIGSHNVRS